MEFGSNTDTSGGTRFSEGKPNPMWTPALGLLEVARVTEYGAQKYAPHDWWVGQSFSTLMGSAARHFLEMLAHGPLSRDPESGLLNAAHCCWNLLCLLNFVYEGREGELDDLTGWVGVTTAMKDHVEAAQRIIKTGRAPDGTPLPPENPRPDEFVDDWKDEQTGHAMGR